MHTGHPTWISGSLTNLRTDAQFHGLSRYAAPISANLACLRESQCESGHSDKLSYTPAVQCTRLFFLTTGFAALAKNSPVRSSGPVTTYSFDRIASDVNGLQSTTVTRMLNGAV